jgi:GNAT superfamily N-acetyltransferase
LSPELAEDYACFFDVTPHSEKPDSDDCKCYCVWWCNDDHDVNHIDYLLTKEKRRSYAIQKIKENKIQGYLAYHNGKVVGWCNANTKADCLKCYCWRRFMKDVSTEELATGIRVKSIFCFLVAPEFRRKGITKLLLERLCQDAVDDGFDFIEAYPLKEYINEAKDFMGPASLFKKYGFTIHGETEDKFIMRKWLK